MKIRQSIAVAAVSAGLLGASGPAGAAAPEREAESQHLQEIWGTCGPGDELVADYTLTETVTVFSPERVTLHLELVGTITRTGSGVTGRFSTHQRDFGYADGSERYVGMLGQLVVAGGGGFTFGGQAWLSPDGVLSFTPGLATLSQVEDEFELVVCDALAG
jgi:hypothetical protein